MPTDAIIDGIRSRTDIDSDEQARDALEAVLETLGERISREEGKDLAHSLPQDLEVAPIDWDSASEGDFDIDEFLDRVMERAGADSRQETQTWSQAVLDALEDEITEPELERVKTQLPQEYDTLFGEAL